MSWEGKIMKSRTSFFSRALYKKDITRFWPIWTIEMILLALAVLMPVFSEMNAYRLEVGNSENYKPGKYILLQLEEYGPFLSYGIIIAAACLIVALFLFSYLFKAREVYSMHFLPLKRETVFFSHYLAGLSILMAPVIVTYLILMCVAASYQAGITIGLLTHLLISLVEIIFFFSLACCVTMLTANGIMATAIYVVVNILYQSVAAMFVFMGSFCIYGYQGDEQVFANTLGQALTPVVFFSGGKSIMDFVNKYYIPSYAMTRAEEDLYIMGRGLETNGLWIGPVWSQALWYLIPAVLLLGLALFLYKKRSLESAGNMMAFSWGKLVFRLVFTVCGSMLFALLMYMVCVYWADIPITYRGVFILFLSLLAVGSILAYLISNMILYKTFFIWKKTSYWRMLLLAGLMVAALSYMKYGYGTKLPEIKKVDYVKLNMDQPAHHNLDNFFYIQGEQEIEDFQRIQGNLLEYADDYNVNVNQRYYSIYNIGVTYVMKDGTSITRSYPLESASWEETGLDVFLDEKETLSEKIFTKAYKEVRPLLVEIESFGSGEAIYQFYDFETMYQFYEAALKDIEEGNLVYWNREEEVHYLKIHFQLPVECMEKYGLSADFIQFVNGNDQGIELPVSDSCKHLNKLIEEKGYSSEIED